MRNRNHISRHARTISIDYEYEYRPAPAALSTSTSRNKVMQLFYRMPVRYLLPGMRCQQYQYFIPLVRACSFLKKPAQDWYGAENRCGFNVGMQADVAEYLFYVFRHILNIYPADGIISHDRSRST